MAEVEEMGTEMVRVEECEIVETELVKEDDEEAEV